MRISTFLFITTGAFAFWLTKGFKGPFNNEMVSINERLSTRGTVRYFLGMGIWIAILIVASVILSRPDEKTGTKAYKAKTNDKGEIIELEEVK